MNTKLNYSLEVGNILLQKISIPCSIVLIIRDTTNKCVLFSLWGFIMKKENNLYRKLTIKDHITVKKHYYYIISATHQLDVYSVNVGFFYYYYYYLQNIGTH